MVGDLRERVRVQLFEPRRESVAVMVVVDGSDEPLGGQLLQRGQRGDDVRIRVGLGMIVMMMFEEERRYLGRSWDHAIGDVARILLRKRLLIRQMNARRRNERHDGRRQLLLERREGYTTAREC